MEHSIRLGSIDQAQVLLGPKDENLRNLEKDLLVKITLREDFLNINGTPENAAKAKVFIDSLLENIVHEKNNFPKTDSFYYMKSYKTDRRKTNNHSQTQNLPKLAHQGQGHHHGTKTIGPKTKGQREYVEAIKKFDIVFGIGPAGTGKTYLAMASAVEALKNQEVRRIILTRPAIEAGESLGYLPGDMYEKISPYLRPMYDAIYDMMEPDRIEKYLETGIIEVAPLAYMRGRTLNEAFIILDEAQNATVEQMKMFLTRLGFDSKAVITGDVTQSDLPEGKPIGLLQATEILKGIEGIKFNFFSGEDVVRHELVQKIILAYEEAGK